MPLDEMRARVATARSGTLGTLDPNGGANLVPVCFALDGNRVLLAVDSKPKRTRQLARVANIRRAGRATLLVDHYEEEWDRLWWVRVRGPALVLEAGPETEAALALLMAKYDQWRADPPAGPVLVLDAADWRGWRAI
jgi:PPOX class probable F420-dependent enzyme